MGDILLSSKKQSRFERMIERAISEEFDSDADVLVNSDGKVYVRAEGGQSDAADVMEDADALYEVLLDLDFSFESSSYELTDGGENESLVGASFYLERAGW